MTGQRSYKPDEYVSISSWSPIGENRYWNRTVQMKVLVQREAGKEEKKKKKKNTTTFFKGEGFFLPEDGQGEEKMGRVGAS